MRKLKLLMVAGIAVFLMPFAILAQEANCQNPQTTLEMNMCAKKERETADRELNENYAKARENMREIDSYLSKDLQGAEKALLEGQRAWIKFRDNACAAEGFQVRGGTLERVLVGSCIARLTRQRANDLTILFKKDL